MAAARRRRAGRAWPARARPLAGALLALAGVLTTVACFAARTASSAASPAKLKRPPSSYNLWLADYRPTLTKKLGTTNGAIVFKEAGRQWKTLGAAKKKKYIERAGELKAKYEAQLQNMDEASSATDKAPDKKASKTHATERGTKVGAGSSKASSKKVGRANSLRQLLLGDTSAASATSMVSATPKETKEKKVAKDSKRPKKGTSAASATSMVSATPKETKKKKVAKDSKRPKKPLGAYYIWLRGARSKIVASLPAEDRKNSALVNKAAGAQWRGMSKKSKDAYQKKREAAVEEYEKALAKYEAKET